MSIKRVGVIRGVVAALLVVLVIGLRAEPQTSEAAALFEAAKQKETIEGDIAAAIKLYQAIVDRFGKTDRAVAAGALVRLADCYERHGSAQARATLERLVKEYTDQKDAVAIARARLAASTVAAMGVVNRLVWTGSRVQPAGSVSADGRFLSFVDVDTGDLGIRDLAAGTDRRLTNKGTFEQSGDYAEQSVFSRDGTRIAFSWYNRKTDRYDLRVVSATGAPSQTVKVLYDNPDIQWIGAHDWSADGKWLAVSVSRADKTAQMALVSTVDGTFKPLKTTDWRGPTRVLFSPDSRYLAFDQFPDLDARARDVFVMSADGAREVPAVVNPADEQILGWTPDGRSLLFASDRSGAPGLWSVPVSSGTPTGDAVLLRPALGHMVFTMKMTDAGVLYYCVATGARNVHVAEMDFESGKLLAPARPFTEAYILSNAQPDWSRDGKTLLYQAERSRSLTALMITSLDGRERREVLPRMSYFARGRWAPDGSITVQGEDLKGRLGLFRIDPRTGDASPLVIGTPESTPLQSSWTPDGRTLVYRVGSSSSAHRIVAKDMQTGTEREVASGLSSLFGLALSPDGRYVTYITYVEGGASSTLNVMPIAGGPARVLFRTEARLGLVNFVEWTPDGRRILFATRDGDALGATWSVPLEGGTPAKFELKLDQVAGYQNPRVHPDGRRIAFVSGRPSFEVWALENFLPAAAAPRK